MPPRSTTERHHRFRLRMSPVARTWRVLLFGALLVFFLPTVFLGPDPGWRLVSVLGVLSSLWSLRFVLGPAVEVRDDGLRLLVRWPLRRDIPWYRIVEDDVVPGVWTLELELTDGEVLRLPCVEHLEELYAAVEDRRHDLDG